MAHTAPPTKSRRSLELAFGVLLLVVGASAAVVAVLALNHPRAPQAASASETFSSHSSPSGASGKPTSAPPTSAPPTATAPSPTPTSAATTPAAGAGKLPLIVLNNTSSTPGSVAADRFRQGGWTVSDVSTFDGDILSTAAYYDPNVAGAQAAAVELQHEFPAIQRVKPKFDGLPGGPIVVILTSDYS